jgi:cytoskeletal protein CcmA (bactofilin family)
MMIRGRIESLQDVWVEGEVEGSLEAPTARVIIGSGARLIGDVRTAGIVIEDGAYFQGSIDFINGDAEPVPVHTHEG